MSDARPTIGITMGDPGGIGAEIIVKALADPEIRNLARYVIFGLNELMAYVADSAEIEPYWWRDQHERFCTNGHAPSYPHDAVVLDYDEFSILDAKGPSRAGGIASMQFVNDAINAAMKGKIDALVTAPICKESWKLAGFDRWPGHTELLAEKTKAKRFAMMFAAPPPTDSVLSPHSSALTKASASSSAPSTKPSSNFATPSRSAPSSTLSTSPTRPSSTGSASNTPASPSAASTPTPPRTANSAMKKNASSNPPS